MMAAPRDAFLPGGLLVEPQPDERVRGGGQVLVVAGALADHTDGLLADDRAALLDRE
jgi:hypothetical protein